jgi:LmbE family N-acetylglucosaminyl deacetylase
VDSPAVVVSPHLDDAVLSASSVLAARPGSLIVSAFCNGPRAVDPLPEWDRSSLTFADGDDVIAARRAEDAAAAAVLGATTLHLDHWDGHYRVPAYGYAGWTDPADLARAVAADLLELAARGDARTWVTPLGVWHADHQITAAACRQVAAARPDLEWLVYDDQPYSAESSDDVDAAIGRAGAAGFAVIASGAPANGYDRARKERALACYTSQQAALGSRIALSIDTPERIRRLVAS